MSTQGLFLFFHKLRKGTQIYIPIEGLSLFPQFKRNKLRCIGTQGALLFFHKLRKKHNVCTRAGSLVGWC